MDDQDAIIWQFLRTMPRPIQNPEAYLDWLEANFGPERRKDVEPFWRKVMAANEVDCDIEDEEEDWGLQADWTFEEAETIDEKWDIGDER